MFDTGVFKFKDQMMVEYSSVHHAVGKIPASQKADSQIGTTVQPVPPRRFSSAMHEYNQPRRMMLRVAQDQVIDGTLVDQGGKSALQ